MSDAADNARVFIALWPDGGVRAALREWRDGCAWPTSASPVCAEQLHLTLHFLGNFPRGRLHELVPRLGVRFKPFELALGRPELWHGGIAVLAPDKVPQPLLALHGVLDEALARVGVPIEARPYRPHVTLARRAGPALAPIQGPPIRWLIDGYALMESKAGAGAGYDIVQWYAAAGRGMR